MLFARPTRLVLPLAMLAAIAACGDSTAPSPTLQAPSAPTAIISDGSRAGGNPDFFFLPPVVGNPSNDPDFTPGAFSGGWKPVVEVCEVAATNLAAGCVGGTVRTYSGAAVSVSAEQYQLSIDSKEAWAVAGRTFRFTVKVVGTQPVALGFVDIALLSGAAKNANTGDVVTMQDGRTIPLKFRIEKGATVPSGVTVFSETVVTDAGATVLTGGTGAPGTFALRFPADWLPAGLDQAVIVVERLSTGPGGSCLTSVPNLLQTSDCWRVTSFPEIPRVTQDLTVAFCPAIGQADPRYDAQAIFKFDAPSRLEELESIATTLVNCDPSQIGAAPRQPGMLGTLRYGLASLGRGLSKAFGPNTAYAIDLGWGGRLAATAEDVDGGVFSDFFWGIPLRLEVLDGNGQSGAPGAALAAPLSVRVVGTHLHDDEEITIPGVTVRFFASGGTLGGPTAVTNSDGVATMAWTLGAAAGPQSVVANITSIGVDTTVAFTATANSPLFILVDGSDVSGTTQTVTTAFSGTIATAGGPLTTGCSLVTSNSSVVNIDPPVIVATGTGTAVITATCGAASTSVTYVVEEVPAPPPVDSIQVLVNIITANVPVGADNNVGVLAGTSRQLTVLPYLGGVPVERSCTFALTNPPGPSPRASISDASSGGVTVNGLVVTFAGSPALLAVTCGTQTRTLNIFVQTIG